MADAVAACGSKAELARLSHMSQVQIERIRSGVTKWIRDDTWRRLEPCLRPYLCTRPAAELRDGSCVAYGDAAPVSDEEQQALQMLRSLPPAERQQFIDRLKDGFIRATLASAKTG